MEYVTFAPEHLAGVLRLTAAEGWHSLADDADRAVRALTAPGVYVVVATDGTQVAGFAHALSDGLVVTYLASLIVGAEYRRRGVARQLVTELFRRTGAWRMDLLAEEAAEGFYRTFAHRTKPGYRIYPPGAAAPPG